MNSEAGESIRVSPDPKLIIEALFADLPESFTERIKAMDALRRAFYAELAKRLEPTLNAYAKDQPYTTLEERSELASWINNTVRQLGLALVCPKTQRPAILISDVTGGSRQKLRFRFQTSEASGKRVRNGMSADLPDLHLMQAPGRIENFARGFKGGASPDPVR
jgi:hypothetical protein